MAHPNPIRDAVEALASTADQFEKPLQQLDGITSTLMTQFGNMFSVFQRGYQAWEVSWERVSWSSRSSDRAQGEEWEALVAMGPNILPFVVEKLRDPHHIFAVDLYNTLQTDDRKKVDRNDLFNYSDLQIHAKLIRRLYATRTVFPFLTKVAEWRGHQSAVALSSLTNNGSVNHDSYRELVAMGKHEITPLVMAMYANDHSGWWWELLHELYYGRKSDAGNVDLEKEYAKWKTWFELSIQVQAVDHI